MAVLPMRLNQDALTDLVILNENQSTPTVVLSAEMMSFTVTNTNDSGPGSFRQAILDANANPGADLITFDIGSGQTITPASPLPTITDPVTIDGTSGGKVGLDGNNTSSDGLHITAGSSTVRGLVINHFDGFFSSGIKLEFNGGNIIEGNFIGTDLDGTTALANSIGVDTRSGNNVIGGTTVAAQNVISGNLFGVNLEDFAEDNQVQGNYIGTNAAGTGDLGNLSDGVVLSVGANTVGGTTAGARNVISGNDGYGFEVLGAGNLIQGNYIGISVGGVELGNQLGGLVLLSGASSTTIGGTTPAAGNVISGNGGNGVEIAGTSMNQVQGNYIGTDATGTTDLGNTGDGVLINDAPDNTIGGTVSEARNIISGNDSAGVRITGTNALGNQVQGNYIGTDEAGDSALGNSQDGVVLENDANSNTIGGTMGTTPGGPCTGDCNVISGNGPPGNGIMIQGNGTTGNLVQGNFIGTDVSGTARLANAGDGVAIPDASSNTIGGTTAAARNVISGNSAFGVRIGIGEFINSTATGNLVQGNFIGTTADGTAVLGLFGNASGGVLIINASGNTIGGVMAGARNVISGNSLPGIVGFGGIIIQDNFATGNQVQGNYIGTDVTGSVALPNAPWGVGILGAPGTQIGGTTPGARNVISGNFAAGIEISDADDAEVEGNYIGTTADGTGALGNGFFGVDVVNSSRTMITGNQIGNNQSGGVVVTPTSTGNQISQNEIFANAGLGIDLGDDGVTPNDSGDGDTGPNNLQNFPEISSVTTSSTSTTIIGTLNSTPNTTFTLEFFTNSVQDPTTPCCYGEGESFFTSTDVTTDGSGNMDFTLTIQKTVPMGHQFMSATATDPAKNTSEFSQATPVVSQLPPAPLTVTVPNGGEDWSVNSSQMIQWTSTGSIANVKIELSRNGGATFETLFASTPNDDSEPWIVTGPATTNAIVRISDAADLTTFDDSDGPFTISQPPPPASITVTVPNGGENWQINSNQAIEWTSTGSIDLVKIELSRDGGSTFETLLASTPNDGFQSWTVTGPATMNALVRVSDVAAPATSDSSDRSFTISQPPPPASITIAVPNGGENWPIGTSQTITWTSSGVTGDVKIELSRDGGSTVEILFANTANDGSQSWAVTGPATTQARVKISSVSNPTVTDQSDANFTISGSGPPSITVTVPNGPENWPIGSTQTIQWTSQNLTGNVKIELSRNGGDFQTLFANTANDGSQSWTVTSPATFRAKIRISSVNDPAIHDQSDLNFVISGNSGIITVTSPNGGEVWGIGMTRTITWTSAGVTGNVRLWISRDGGQNYTLIGQTANTGSLQWTVTGPASSQCRIAVQSVNDNTIVDVSNTLFTIQ